MLCICCMFRPVLHVPAGWVNAIYVSWFRMLICHYAMPKNQRAYIDLAQRIHLRMLNFRQTQHAHVDFPAWYDEQNQHAKSCMIQ